MSVDASYSTLTLVIVSLLFSSVFTVSYTKNNFFMFWEQLFSRCSVKHIRILTGALIVECLNFLPQKACDLFAVYDHPVNSVHC